LRTTNQTNDTKKVFLSSKSCSPCLLSLLEFVLFVAQSPHPLSILIWMRFDLVIDGYNLMHAAGLARERYAQGDLERCRTRLLTLVRHGLTKEQRANTIVVFDGQNAESFDEAEFKYHGIRVFFSRSHEEADDVIEQLIAGHSFPKQLRIISSDHRLHKAGRVRRAEVSDSEEFLIQLERTTRRKRDQPEDQGIPLPEKPSSVDAEKWMEEFGEINLSEIEASLHQEAKREEQIRKEANLLKKKRQEQKNSSKPIEQTSETEHIEVPDPLQEKSPLDLEFWENRIAELDREEF
jgi:uncharacterized protein